MAGWIAPASQRCHPVNLTWSPSIRLIRINRRVHLEHRIDDPPCFFHIVLSREQGGIPFHCRSQQSLVCVHVGRLRRSRSFHFNCLAHHAFPRSQHHHPHCDGNFGA